MAKDYYKILGIERKADEKEIKKAYRKMARQYHPDINPNNKSAEAKFKEINEAYQVLSDKEKRALYDQFGEDFDKYQQAGYTPGAAGRPGPPPGTVDFSEIFNQARRGAGPGGGVPGAGMPGAGRVQVEDLGAGGVGDLFENLFGNVRGGRVPGAGGRRARGPVKGEDIEQPLEISLAESIRGTQRSLQLTIRDPNTATAQVRNVTVKIPAGVKEDARVRVANQGVSGSSGGPNGDLYLRIHIQPHPFWKREGDDLHCEVPLTYTEAALGAQVPVPTLSGQVQMKVPAGTQCGQVFRLTGRGVPHVGGSGAGDQFVKVKIAVPKKLASREEELIRELAQLRNENVRQNLPAAL